MWGSLFSFTSECLDRFLHHGWSGCVRHALYLLMSKWSDCSVWDCGVYGLWFLWIVVFMGLWFPSTMGSFDSDYPADSGLFCRFYKSLQFSLLLSGYGRWSLYTDFFLFYCILDLFTFSKIFLYVPHPLHLHLQWLKDRKTWAIGKFFSKKIQIRSLLPLPPRQEEVDVLHMLLRLCPSN